MIGLVDLRSERPEVAPCQVWQTDPDGDRMRVIVVGQDSVVMEDLDTKGRCTVPLAYFRTFFRVG